MHGAVPGLLDHADDVAAMLARLRIFEGDVVVLGAAGDVERALGVAREPHDAIEQRRLERGGDHVVVRVGLEVQQKCAAVGSLAVVLDQEVDGGAQRHGDDLGRLAVLRLPAVGTDDVLLIGVERHEQLGDRAHGHRAAARRSRSSRRGRRRGPGGRSVSLAGGLGPAAVLPGLGQPPVVGFASAFARRSRRPWWYRRSGR